MVRVLPHPQGSPGAQVVVGMVCGIRIDAGVLGQRTLKGWPSTAGPRKRADYGSDVEGSVTQVVGRKKITGYFVVAPLTCDGETHPWEALVVSDTGLFAGGKAANFSLAIACGLLDCGFADASGTVQVSRSGK